MGYVFYSKNIKLYSKVFMKLKTKGGFSSKLIESLIELGQEASILPIAFLKYQKISSNY